MLTDRIGRTLMTSVSEKWKKLQCESGDSGKVDDQYFSNILHDSHVYNLSIVLLTFLPISQNRSEKSVIFAKVFLCICPNTSGDFASTTQD